VNRARGTFSGVRTLAGCADTSKHGRVRFVIALGGNSGAMRFRLLKAIESVDNHPARSKSLRCPLRVTNGHLASEALSVLCRTGRAKKTSSTFARLLGAALRCNAQQRVDCNLHCPSTSAKIGTWTGLMSLDALRASLISF
jgi:hypothetical protein